tara:strand:+ start:544 stop:1128 length:585 start_codon:yes stop_codon:yes gene_type:complete
LQKKNSLNLKKIFVFIAFLICPNLGLSEDMVLSNFKNVNLSTQFQEWNFITDQVMGGVSSGKIEIEKIKGIKCYRMTGNVSTKNNGGFIQIRTKLKPEIDTNKYKGLYIKVYGNGKNYNLHLRTGLTFAPWQFYSFTFYSPKKWTKIIAPFSEFKKSNFYQPKSILGQDLKSVGLVAGFDDFESDICLGEIGFY